MAQFNPDLLLKDELCYEAPVSYTHLDVYKRQIFRYATIHIMQITALLHIHCATMNAE